MVGDASYGRIGPCCQRTWHITNSFQNMSLSARVAWYACFSVSSCVCVLGLEERHSTLLEQTHITMRNITLWLHFCGLQAGQSLVAHRTEQNLIAPLHLVQVIGLSGYECGFVGYPAHRVSLLVLLFLKCHQSRTAPLYTMVLDVCIIEHNTAGANQIQSRICHTPLLDGIAPFVERHATIYGTRDQCSL